MHRAPDFGVQKPVSPTLHKTPWPCFNVVSRWKRRLLGQNGQLQEKLSEESGVACRGSALEEGYPSTEGPWLESWGTGLRTLPSQPFGSQYLLFSFCDSWATMTRCNRACVKSFAVKKSDDFRRVLLKIKGAVRLGRNHTHYFPIPVLLKQNQKLPKRLGAGGAWMRTHIEHHTWQQR